MVTINKKLCEHGVRPSTSNPVRPAKSLAKKIFERRRAKIYLQE